MAEQAVESLKLDCGCMIVYFDDETQEFPCDLAAALISGQYALWSLFFLYDDKEAEQEALDVGKQIGAHMAAGRVVLS